MVGVSLYFSHTIRGKDGDACTYEKKWDNISRAIDAASHLTQLLNVCLCQDQIEVRLYVPGEHELLFEKLYNAKVVTVAQVLQADTEIMLECDGVVLWPIEGTIEESAGMSYEKATAIEHGLPVIEPQITKVQDLCDMIRNIAKSKTSVKE